MVPVVALIKAKVGMEKTLETILKGLVAPTRKESGCLRYDLHRDQADPRMFVFVENWKSVPDLQAHLSSAHIAAGMERKAELIESLEIRSLAQIDAG
jgi:quinol monooxygenase YgiN